MAALTRVLEDGSPPRVRPTGPPLAVRDKAAALACSSEAGLLSVVLSGLRLLRTISSIVTIPVTV